MTKFNILSAFVGLTVIFVLVSSCGDSGSGGASFNAPQMQPPVLDSTPESLRPSNGTALVRGASRAFSQDAVAELEVIRSDFFGPGPGDFTDRLGMIDERLAELDGRHQQNARDCVDEEAVLWEPQDLLGGAEFPMYFSCSEEMNGNSGLRVFFGRKDDNFYLAEIQNPQGVPAHEAPQMAVLARADVSGNEIEVWQIMINTVEDRDEAHEVFHIKANRATSVLEVSYVSNVPSGSTGCGVRMKTDGTLVYAEGVFGSPDAADSCDDGVGSFPRDPVCASAEDLTSLDDECDAVENEEIKSFSVVEVDFPDLDGGTYAAMAKIVQNPEVPSLTDFNTSSPTDEE